MDIDGRRSIINKYGQDDDVYLAFAVLGAGSIGNDAVVRPVARSIDMPDVVIGAGWNAGSGNKPDPTRAVVVDRRITGADQGPLEDPCASLTWR